MRVNATELEYYCVLSFTNEYTFVNNFILCIGIEVSYIIDSTAFKFPTNINFENI